MSRKVNGVPEWLHQIVMYPPKYIIQDTEELFRERTRKYSFFEIHHSKEDKHAQEMEQEGREKTDRKTDGTDTD